MWNRLLLIACSVGWLLAATAKEFSSTKHISSADGLSNDFVTCLTVDSKGHVWVGTEAGVNRIVGKSCQPFHLSGWMAGLCITALCWHEEDGKVLIGTELGLGIYNPDNGQIRYLNAYDGLVRSSINAMSMAEGGVWLGYGDGQVQWLNFKTMEAEELRLSQNYGIRCVTDDGKGHLYIGHSRHGMTVVTISNGVAKNFMHQNNDASGLPGNNVRKIYQDREGRIWVGTDNGLALFHPDTDTFTKVTRQQDDYDDNVYDIHQTADGRLWVATDMGGVKIVAPEAAATDGGLHFEQTQVRLSSLNTRSITEDEYGNIWVGNHSTGVDFISNMKPYFSLLDDKTEGEPHSAAGDYPSVYAMAEDTDGGFWMATENELTLLRKGKIEKRWRNPNMQRREMSSPRCLMADHQDGVWIGVDDQGVYHFDKHTEQFSFIPISPAGSDIHCFAEDADGRIWIGGEMGVWIYEDGKATKQETVSNIIHAPATCIMQTDTSQLFVSTMGDGIYSIDMKTMTSHHLNMPGGLPSGKINQALACGGRKWMDKGQRPKENGVWLATDGGLVHLEDPIGLTGISVYGTEQGLDDNHILAIQQDGEGNIWMSTYLGISCLVESTKKIYNYNQHDTRLFGGFAIGASTTDENGNIFFGSASGVCYFNPLQMGDKVSLSDVQIIECEAYNPVGSNTEIQLLKPDSQGRVFTTYRQNTIRLTFAMHNFAQTDQVDFSYMMKGMDGKWYDIGSDHDVVFRGLRPGSYTFVLRAKLRNQDWDQAKDTKLDIIIKPPFWRTWWAYTLLVLLVVALIAFFLHLYKRKLTLQNVLELERQESLQKQKLNEERLRFFTNITHELRTPLTLILGPLDDLMEDHDLSQQNRSRVTMIHKSAERLRSLITEILEFRKTETQNRRLTVARGDIGQFVREICLNYKELNRNDKVHFECVVDEKLPTVWFDSEIITTVMNNFLSNAIKYTEQGSITTTVSSENGTVKIAVADTGYGISPEALPHVFERYYQVKGNHQASGTGIGLALVKSLAELHQAKVSVESHKGKGSTFMLSLDVNNSYPQALHKEDEENKNSPQTALNTECTTNSTEPKSPPQLLVIEDNDDIRQYIADSFCEDFRILQATNGEEGLALAREHIPDIVVSDIMMPRMNGIEFTKQMKGNITTSHIPIILLTAKTTDDDKEEGYDSGADSYLTKPFTVKLLASRIRNLLNARRRLAEMIASGNVETMAGGADEGASAQPADKLPKLSRLDQEFIERLNRIIGDHIMQVDIGMPFITEKMAMSHSTFYRKVKALTGMTATEYIRKRRLHHCYQLLESGDYNVNEAAMMTGFNQMAHFRETFKKEFGMLPSEVKKKA